MAEEKSEPKETKNKSKEEKQNLLMRAVPAYLCILLVLLSFILGFFLSYRFFPSLVPKQECPSIDDELIKVDVILLYSDECKLCERINSIIDVFNDRGIPYSLREVEVSTPEGVALVAKYNVTEVPSALVSYEKMKYYPTTEKGISQRFKRVIDRYVVNELNFNPRKYYNSMFLSPDCNKEDEKVNIILFDDPYQKISLLKSGYVINALQKFGDNIKLDYVYVSTIDDANYAVEMAAAGRSFYCASKLGKYLAFENSFRSKFCNFDANEGSLTEQELMFCASGGSVERPNRNPLDLFELAESADAAGLVGYSFDTCQQNQDEMFSFWDSKISEYSIPIREMPIAIAAVDCKYLVNLENLEKAICEAKPSLEGCNAEK